MKVVVGATAIYMVMGTHSQAHKQRGRIVIGTLNVFGMRCWRSFSHIENRLICAVRSK